MTEKLEKFKNENESLAEVKIEEEKSRKKSDKLLDEKIQQVIKIE